ncbi:MAG: MgtC/SapB family protein [Promethearchaeota archaeon]|nr:MAG: MgtC/SapB family protein [Candidatus Lokiarchaeota archaeon]
MSYSILLQTITVEEFYALFLKLLVSFFCGFVIGIERTRVSAQYGARDHIFFSMIATALIILYETFLPSQEGFVLIIITLSGMIIFLLIGSIYRLFKENDAGYTTTLSMLLAIIVGILCFYNESLAIVISVFFLIILSTKKQFNKIRSLQDIEWQGTIEFIAIIVLLYILIPDNLEILSIQIKPIITIFIVILAIKYFSYFILKSSFEKNLYYISFLGGFAHSEATTTELAQVGASSSSIWLVIQTMLVRMIIVLLITPSLLYYALYPILITVIIGLSGSFLILRKKQTRLDFDKIKNPLSLKSALIFAGTYFIAVVITFLLKFVNLNIILYYIIVFCIGFLSGGASSLFVATSFFEGLINEGNALIMLSIGLSAAILNKLFYSTRSLKAEKDKRIYAFHLILYILITISILVSATVLTIYFFNLAIF